jgi:hypothetical protein
MITPQFEGYTVPMLSPPPNTILEVSMMYAVSRCLHVIAEMGVADALGDDPRTAVDLAEITGTNSDAVARALGVLSAYGIFERRNDCSGHTSFAHTPASWLLRTDHPQSMRSFVRMIGSTVFWKSLELLAHSMRTGEPAMEQVTPGGAWAYYAEHPEESRILDEAMMGRAHGQITGILAGYDFRRSRLSRILAADAGIYCKQSWPPPPTPGACSSINRMSSKTQQVLHRRALKFRGATFSKILYPFAMPT